MYTTILLPSNRWPANHCDSQIGQEITNSIHKQEASLPLASHAAEGSELCARRQGNTSSGLVRAKCVTYYTACSWSSLLGMTSAWDQNWGKGLSKRSLSKS
eukprot:scpid71285/ scgid6754/ 